ncbi:hypothetical protein [Candidatus Leptofilum sp.]|uniref:hypothetical protein n=1 Tax=Candidatus Leptofilum sp. TaxID=3241576 RepID=UPI003B5BC963
MFTTDQLLDRIFRDPKVKYKLDLFTTQEKKRLQMFEKNGRVRIRCMVRDRDYIAKSEEVVRQLMMYASRFAKRICSQQRI